MNMPIHLSIANIAPKIEWYIQSFSQMLDERKYFGCILSYGNWSLSMEVIRMKMIKTENDRESIFLRKVFLYSVQF